jgi:hypothetical protein
MIIVVKKIRGTYHNISGGGEIKKFYNAVSAPCLFYDNTFCNWSKQQLQQI